MLIHLEQEMNYSYFEHSFFWILFVSSHLEWLEVVSTHKGRKALYVVFVLVTMMENKIFERDLHNLGTEATSEVGTGAYRLD